MLAKKFKFTKQDFDKIKENTEKRQNTVFGLVYFLKCDLDRSTIVIPKKIYKKAHDRNQIKRIFYKILKESKTKENLNLAVFIKSKLEPIHFKAEISKIMYNIQNN
jgi:ribonuclease P protein component